MIQIVDTIQGDSFLDIQSAMEIFQLHNPDLAQSEIKLINDGYSKVIILANKDDPENIKNTLGVRLESKMELSTQDLIALLSHKDQIQLIDEIQGSSYHPINTAVEVFKQYNPDLTYYNIQLVRESDALIVIFADKDRPIGAHGSFGKPGFEVELNALDLRVKGSYFVR